jgi:hypothetical protein
LIVVGIAMFLLFRFAKARTTRACKSEMRTQQNDNDKAKNTLRTSDIIKEKQAAMLEDTTEISLIEKLKKSRA